MKKVLMMASVASMIESFNQENIKLLQDDGFEVHVMANFDELDEKRNITNTKYKELLENKNIKVFDLPIQRNPFKPINVSVYNNIKEIFKKENYSLIHCHTPIGGVMGRLAARETQKNGTRVIYTAHGFHFYKGAPIKNWLLYYTVEKSLSPLTDCLITINPEDYNNAKNKHFRAKNIEMIKGVGIDLKKFSPTSSSKRNRLRKKFGYSKKDILLIYVGELIERKNQKQAIFMMKEIVKYSTNVKLLLVGDGECLSEYQSLVNKLNLTDNIQLLGYRADIPDLMSLSDISISTSLQEGLPVNVMEAMATGLPLVVTDCRGNRDLVQNGINGYVVPINNPRAMADKVLKLSNQELLRKTFGSRNTFFITPYETRNVNPQMNIIYQKYIKTDLATNISVESNPLL